MFEVHHREQHQIGQPAFERKHQISLFRTAASFYHASPDHEMQEALKDVAIQYLDDLQ